MKSAASAVLLFVMLGCAHQNAQQEIASVAEVGLDLVDPEHKMKLIFSSAVPSNARQVLLTLREPAYIGDDDEWKYVRTDVLRVDTLVIEANSAVFAVWRGPRARSVPGTITVDCGNGTRLSLEKKPNGVWQVTGIAITVC